MEDGPAVDFVPLDEVAEEEDGEQGELAADAQVQHVCHIVRLDNRPGDVEDVADNRLEEDFQTIDHPAPCIPTFHTTLPLHSNFDFDMADLMGRVTVFARPTAIEHFQLCATNYHFHESIEMVDDAAHQQFHISKMTFNTHRLKISKIHCVSFALSLSLSLLSLFLCIRYATLLPQISILFKYLV